MYDVWYMKYMKLKTVVLPLQLIVYMDLIFLCFDVILLNAMVQKKSRNSQDVRTLAPSSKPTKPPTSPKRLSSVKAG